MNDIMCISISQPVYDEIRHTFLYNGYESAGIVGFQGTDIAWIRRLAGAATEVSFMPSPSDLESAYDEIIRAGIYTGWGILHSHPENEPLSPTDIKYAREILINNRIEVFPMILLEGIRLKVYLVTLNSCYESQIIIR